MSSAVSFPLLRRIRDFHPLETCAARRMKKSRSRLFRARAVCEAYTSFPRGAHPRGAFYVIGISYHIINRLSATGFALCDEQPGCPRSRFSPSITSPRWRALPPASQAARSLMAREKQMPLSASLVFLSCSLYSTIGLKGNTVNGMTFKPIQIWYYSSLVASWEQISRLRENLLPGSYEGSAIS